MRRPRGRGRGRGRLNYPSSSWIVIATPLTPSNPNLEGEIGFGNWNEMKWWMITTRYWVWQGRRANKKSRRRFGNWRWSCTQTSTLTPPRRWGTAPLSDLRRLLKPIRSSSTIASAPTTISEPPLLLLPPTPTPTPTIEAVTVTVIVVITAAEEEEEDPTMPLEPLGLIMCFAILPRAPSFSMSPSQGLY